MPLTLKSIISALELSRASAYGIITIGWHFLSGPISALLIMSLFTPELQGYYYTFASVLALQMFLELGLGPIITYFAAHEWAKLSFDKKGYITGDSRALSRLISLGHSSLRWYLIGGGIIAFGISSGGYFFFLQSPEVGINWVVPWFSLSVLTGVIFVMTPVWAILEGCNQVSQVYSFRMVNSVLGTIATWSSIYLGAALWTASISSGVFILSSAFFLLWRYYNFIKSFISRPSGPRVSWSQEIWKIQWRAAITAVGNYFSFYFFTPVLFHFHGPAIGGQFGLSMSIVLTIASVSAMWSKPRGPQFAVMIANKEYKALDSLLYRIIKVSVVILFFGTLAVWLFVYGLNIISHPFSSRIIAPLPLALFLIGVLLGNALYPTSVYLRAHKCEPYAMLTIVNAVVTGSLSLVLGIKYAVIGVAVAYLMTTSLILLPWQLAIFLRYRREFLSRVV